MRTAAVANATTLGDTQSAADFGNTTTANASNDSKGTQGVATTLAGKKSFGKRPNAGRATGNVNKVATTGTDTMAIHLRTGAHRVSCHNTMPNVAKKLRRAPKSCTKHGRTARRNSPTKERTATPLVRLPNDRTTDATVAMAAALNAEGLAPHTMTYAHTAGMDRSGAQRLPNPTLRSTMDNNANTKPT